MNIYGSKKHYKFTHDIRGEIILLILVFLYMNSGKVKEGFYFFDIKTAYNDCITTCITNKYSNNNGCNNICTALENGICSGSGFFDTNLLKGDCKSVILKKYAGDQNFKVVTDKAASLNSSTNPNATYISSIFYTSSGGLPFNAAMVNTKTSCPDGKSLKPGKAGIWGIIATGYCA